MGLNQPRPMFELPETLPEVANVTRYELALVLEVRGCGWRALPRRRRQQQELALQIGGGAPAPLVWCSRAERPLRPTCKRLSSGTPGRAMALKS